MSGFGDMGGMLSEGGVSGPSGQGGSGTNLEAGEESLGREEKGGAGGKGRGVRSVAGGSVAHAPSAEIAQKLRTAAGAAIEWPGGPGRRELVMGQGRCHR